MRNPNTSLLISLLCLMASMVLLSFAAVPIYSLFCKATGFGGTTKSSPIYSQRKGTRQIVVEFDANIDPKLNWSFVPKQQKTEILPGQNVLVFYESENLSDKNIIGTAVYNVTPNKAAKYFVKVHCFCFEEQLLKAGVKVLMPVSFFIDPQIEDDRAMDDVDRITLSYTFFKLREVQ